MSCEAAKEEFGEISPVELFSYPEYEYESRIFLISMLPMGKLRGEGYDNHSPHGPLSMASTRAAPNLQQLPVLPVQEVNNHQSPPGDGAQRK